MPFRMDGLVYNHNTRLLSSQHHSKLLCVCFYQSTSKMSLLGEFARVTPWSVAKGNLLRGNLGSNHKAVFSVPFKQPYWVTRKCLETMRNHSGKWQEPSKKINNTPQTFWNCPSNTCSDPHKIPWRIAGFITLAHFLKLKTLVKVNVVFRVTTHLSVLLYVLSSLFLTLCMGINFRSFKGIKMKLLCSH